MPKKYFDSELCILVLKKTKMKQKKIGFFITKVLFALDTYNTIEQNALLLYFFHETASNTSISAFYLFHLLTELTFRNFHKQ